MTDWPGPWLSVTTKSNRLCETSMKMGFHAIRLFSAGFRIALILGHGKRQHGIRVQDLGG